MPISSSNQRLTRELFRPPPQSLEQLRLSQQYRFHSSGNIALRHGLNTSGLIRERHLDGTPPRKMKNKRKFSIKKRKWSVMRNSRIKKVQVRPGGTGDQIGASNQGNFVGIRNPSWGSTGCCGLPWCMCGIFTRCGILSLLLGFLLGALLIGLIVGLILYAEILARDERIAALQQDFQDCFKDPCPTRSSSCAYATDDTEIECFCNQNETLQALSPAGYIDGYRCTFFNTTTISTTSSV